MLHPAAVCSALVPAGTATVYFTDDPTSRDFTNLADRKTWGTPVATFVREGIHPS